MFSPVLYFDHNATHPLCDEAREAWLRATRDFIGNPASAHRLGARAEAALEQARERLAGWLGCAAREIVWTGGATEAANAALHHAAQTSDGAALISSLEHPCVQAAARKYFAGRCETIPAARAGVIDLAWLAKRLEHKLPALVAVMAANNETGVLQPWTEALALCRERGVPLFCDAAQWVGKLPAAGLGAADFVSGCAHKCGGPQGVGFLKVPARFQPLLVGGPQEDGRRAGTANVAGVLAMTAAFAAREAALAKDSAAALLVQRAVFETQLAAAVPGATILGAGADRLWNTVSAMMPEIADCRQRWVVKLDKLGFAVSTGSACASGQEAPSQVLTAMGFNPAEASRVLRFSGGWETRAEDWSRLLEGVARAHAELARGSQ